MERRGFERLITGNLPLIEAVTKKYARRYGRLREWEYLMQTVLLKMLRSSDLYDDDEIRVFP